MVPKFLIGGIKMEFSCRTQCLKESSFFAPQLSMVRFGCPEVAQLVNRVVLGEGEN